MTEGTGTRGPSPASLYCAGFPEHCDDLTYKVLDLERLRLVMSIRTQARLVCSHQGLLHTTAYQKMQHERLRRTLAQQRLV